MNKTDTQKELDVNIPKDVVHTRSQGGKDLSYLEAWYVTDRMNQVLGQGNWGYQIVSLDKVFEGKTEQYSGEVFATSYTARVSLFANIDGRTVIFTEVGYGDGTDKKNPGKAHELATKEAVSDGVKRAAKNLGRSMGLALYDKTQEYVGMPKVIDFNALAEKDNARVNSSSISVRPIKELVTAAFKVLEAQKKITKDEFKEKYQKGVGISALTDIQLSGILDSIKKDYPHLTL